MEVLSNVIEMVIYVLIGLVFCFIGYKFTEILYKKHFKVTEEIDNNNKAVGIMVAGMFISVAIIMSGVL